MYQNSECRLSTLALVLVFQNIRCPYFDEIYAECCVKVIIILSHKDEFEAFRMPLLPEGFVRA